MSSEFVGSSPKIETIDLNIEDLTARAHECGWVVPSPKLDPVRTST
jgi:hypothetical protein